MNEQLKSALMATLTVFAVMTVLVARFVLWPLLRGDPADLTSSLVMIGFFATVTLLGLAIAWWRFYRDRRQRRRRPKPLNLG